jgi:colicin import membrane protein
MMTLTSEKKKAIVGTTLIHAVVFVGLLLFGFTIPEIKPPEEGLLVNFGVDETGSGLIEPSAPSNPVKAAPAVATSVSTAKEEALMTQNNEEAPIVKKADPDAEKKRIEKIEADKKHREELEAERVLKQKEELERKRIAAEQQRQSDIMNRTKNALANSKNAGTNSTSEGITGGTGNQGSPNGSVDSQNHGIGGGSGNSGISYDLGGRGFQKLPDPKYEYQGEGKVVVEISVDKSGKVIQAISGVKGSTILDDYLVKSAKEAALAATFEVKADAPEVQKGTITYTFKLR